MTKKAREKQATSSGQRQGIRRPPVPPLPPQVGERAVLMTVELGEWIRVGWPPEPEAEALAEGTARFFRQFAFHWANVAGLDWKTYRTQAQRDYEAARAQGTADVKYLQEMRYVILDPELTTRPEESVVKLIQVALAVEHLFGLPPGTGTPGLSGPEMRPLNDREEQLNALLEVYPALAWSERESIPKLIQDIYWHAALRLQQGAAQTCRSLKLPFEEQARQGRIQMRRGLYRGLPRLRWLDALVRRAVFLGGWNPSKASVQHDLQLAALLEHLVKTAFVEEVTL